MAGAFAQAGSKVFEREKWSSRCAEALSCLKPNWSCHDSSCPRRDRPMSESGAGLGPVVLSLGGVETPVDREVFSALFESSVVATYAGVRNALNGSPLPFQEFLKLATQAEIPYPLFFAPLPVVRAQLHMKTQKLMSGFTKAHFSMHSRQRVELRDVELIVKDLLRKQELLRRFDKSLVDNQIVGIIRGSKRGLEQDAEIVRAALGLGPHDTRNARTKAAAVELLIRKLESRQVFVARSSQHYMPQEMPHHAKFSGMTIRDKKVPFIFLASGNEGEQLEPDGRKLFTLTLLTVLIARGTFAPVNYDGHTTDATSPREYELTAEILLPAADMRNLAFGDLDDIRSVAETFRVTPSAVAMRVWRLNLISRTTFENHMDTLRDEYARREKPRLSSPLAVNALRKYNGVECSRRMLAMMDAGQISRADFRRIVCLNKISAAEIGDFRRSLG